eukprot:6902888-Prymnesium_polylepis.2
MDARPARAAAEGQRAPVESGVSLEDAQGHAQGGCRVAKGMCTQSWSTARSAGPLSPSQGGFGGAAAQCTNRDAPEPGRE